ncbi:hypothetical protein XENOCAPTIV_028809, partial [Xenoophorus captivus]
GKNTVGVSGVTCFSLPAHTSPPPVLKSVPFTARTAKRGSRFFCEANLCDDANC